jgi:serine/threonine-protein kinase
MTLVKPADTASQAEVATAPSQGDMATALPQTVVATAVSQAGVAAVPPPAASATIAFTVSPWGEVVVDGRSYGATPPLTHLPLPPGEHAVEIRNGVSDPYRTVVRIEPDQVLRIQHKFEDLHRSQ